MTTKPREESTCIQLSNKYSDNKTYLSHSNITKNDVRNLYQNNSISKEIFDYCIYSFISSNENENEKPTQQSLFILFEDLLNEIINDNSDQFLKYLDKDNLVQKRYIFIPIHANSNWSLVIIENPHLIFKDKIIDLYYNNDFKELSVSENKFRIITLTAKNEKIDLVGIMKNFERLLIKAGIHAENQLFEKERMNKELNSSRQIFFSEGVGDYESGLVIMKLICEGTQSDSMGSYIDSLLNNSYNEEFVTEVITRLRPSIQAFFPFDINKGNCESFSTEKKHQSIKEIPIIYSSKKKKAEPNIYRKTVIPKNSPSKGSMTEYILKCGQFEDEYISERENTHKSKHFSQSKYSDVSNMTTARDYNEIKTKTIPLHSKSMQDSSSSFIYHPKKISNSKLNHMTFSQRETSRLSQPQIESSFSKNIITHLDLTIINQSKNHNKNNTNFTVNSQEILFLRNGISNDNPKKSTRNSIHSKNAGRSPDQLRRTNNLINLRDYSASDMISDNDNSHDNDPCGKCGETTNCIIM